jgi:hypothetical protein
MESMTVRQEGIPESLLSRLESRDIALWVSGHLAETVDSATLAAIIRLPWQAVLLEGGNAALDTAITAQEDPSDFKVLRRGYPIIIEGNPADIVLPPRSLPVYKRDAGGVRLGTLAAQLSRLSILNELVRANPRELLVLSSSESAVPADLRALWEEGFRPLTTVVGSHSTLFAEVDEWRHARAAGGSVATVETDVSSFARDLSSRYDEVHAGERVFLRVRNARGGTRSIDVTRADDAQHPVLGRYELIQDNDLRTLSPEDLTAEVVEGFFRDPSASWQPYAAGLPWQRDEVAWPELRRILRRLDRTGAEANTVAFIRAEAGAGGTTQSRMLSWKAASEGYPTLLARRAPFKPIALEIVGFMTRMIEAAKQAPHEVDEGRHYEAPWLIVFDRDHWEGRASDLRNFLRELEQSGRAACVLVVTGPYASMEFLSSPRFREIEQLTHEVPRAGAVEFGKHLNRYLAPHGPVRRPEEWQGFFQASAVHAESGISSFWVALSFWLQRQIDLSETVQSWLFRQFQSSVSDPQVRSTLVDIAAMSTERRPLPETMLPATVDWPVTQKLEDLRTTIGAMGLVRLRLEGDRYWALAHDVLGRYLLNAIYYDRSVKEEFDFGEASNAEHLRFLALRRLSANPALGTAANREIAEDFAVNIFKIDPEHGHGTFAPYWREALSALDAMPKLLWQTSRALRHHSAISRRRIANDKLLFSLPENERLALLQRAVEDIRFALDMIPRTEGAESDLNLYNSLARAYQDLHDEATATGAASDELDRLRALAQDATRRAFQLNPDSPFVVETYARSLLGEAKTNPEKAAENAIEALNLVYLEMERDRSTQRRFELSRLAEGAIETLLAAGGTQQNSANPEIAIIVAAVDALTRDVHDLGGVGLSDFPVENRLAAAEILSNSDVQLNLQAVRMLYALKCLNTPRAFADQLSLLEALSSGGYPVSPQQRLELAVLMHQRGRYEDAERLFKQLRPLWRTGEFYVQVPERLRWLLDVNTSDRLQVTARVAAGGEARGFANIQDMRNLSVRFRAEEFGQRHLSPGTQIRGYVSFGHNGPFLRPLTASVA